MHTIEPEDLTPSKRGHLLALLAKAAAPEDHASLHVLRCAGCRNLAQRVPQRAM